MAHKEQQDFCLKIKKEYPMFFNKVKVLDVGSLDINGNNRNYFIDSDYTGIDLGKGKNVDLVCRACEFPIPNKKFDVIISTECFEHDMFLDKTLNHIVKLLRSGGLFLFTCAGIGRVEHGTKRYSQKSSPFTSSMDDEWSDYYKNLSEEMIRQIINVDDLFSKYQFSGNNTHNDLLFFGVK